ncbi:MAG: dihydroorotase [bacterium]
MTQPGNKKVIRGAYIVNEGETFSGDVFIDGDLIEKVVRYDSGSKEAYDGYAVIDGEGKYLLPGVIDDQVHFREPGLVQKADIYTESRAAVAGGITSYMEMPNTVPNTLTQELLEEKYLLASKKSLANYSFYMGASNDNLDEILKTDPSRVCGIKVFMGSSTGNMLVDSNEALQAIFSSAPTLVAVHCEDEKTIRANTLKFKDEFGNDAPTRIHPLIRSAEACYLSSSRAVELAKKNGTRLHILHLSSAKEMALFDNDLSLTEKRITAEVCVHHLWFSDEDYEQKGNFIKWNPAVKSPEDREALFNALLNNKLDVVATDHAPHTLEEKRRPYFEAPSGGPMVQHALVAMLEFVHQERISLEQVVEKMCHNPAILFKMDRRGYIESGFYADLVLVDMDKTWEANKENILYKCGWSPMEGVSFRSSVLKTFVNGHLAFDEGKFDESRLGARLTFKR